MCDKSIDFLLLCVQNVHLKKKKIFSILLIVNKTLSGLNCVRCETNALTGILVQKMGSNDGPNTLSYTLFSIAGQALLPLGKCIEARFL